jgi:hypothetical protein
MLPNSTNIRETFPNVVYQALLEPAAR